MAKYNKKMTSMIKNAYKSAEKGTTQLDTAIRVLEDYRTLWPKSSHVSKITPEQIRAKFHTLRTEKTDLTNRVYVASKKVNAPMSTSNKVMKKLIAHLIEKADKLDMDVKDGVVTVQFNL
tara:strand:+ start:301 stop:660 length:360 start_codon:yes stop_codon:yes gene_type:complete